MYDLVIVGGGPAGIAAGVYAARKKIKTALVTDNFGGQSLVSADIQNWIGIPSISGFDLAKMLEEHLQSYPEVEIVYPKRATKIEKLDGGFQIQLDDQMSLETRTILLATGSRRKRLGIPGEDKFDGKGVAWCSTCDAPIFKDKTVAVIGGGNAGLEAVVDLLPYAAKICLLHRRDQLKGDPVTQEKIKSNSQVEIILQAQTSEILGGKFVTGLKYRDLVTGQDKELKVDGIFVEVGVKPNVDLVENLVNLNDRGEIVVDHKTQQTSLKGIWAAGDVTDVLYKQNNISAGDAVKAVLNIYEYFNGRGGDFK